LGTASLVFGLISMGFGILFGIITLFSLMASNFSFMAFYTGLIITTIFFVIGGLLLRKYDKDKKKEKSKTKPDGYYEV
jgi:heme A synthase